MLYFANRYSFVWKPLFLCLDGKKPLFSFSAACASFFLIFFISLRPVRRVDFLHDKLGEIRSNLWALKVLTETGFPFHSSFLSLLLFHSLSLSLPFPFPLSGTSNLQPRFRELHNSKRKWRTPRNYRGI